MLIDTRLCEGFCFASLAVLSIRCWDVGVRRTFVATTYTLQGNVLGPGIRFARLLFVQPETFQYTTTKLLGGGEQACS